MDIANRFKLFKIKYGYKILEHIQGEYDDKKGHHVVDYWGNNKYPATIAQAREYLIEHFEEELVKDDKFIEFTKAVDKMQQLKDEVMELSVEDKLVIDDSEEGW